MKIQSLDIAGVHLISPEKHRDERGFFARTFCMKELASAGLHSEFPQSNVSFNVKKGTFRGMHFQKAPKEEIKIVRCTRGTIFDVVVDLRPDSKTFKKWLGVELTDSGHDALYVPAGFAHGFQTLSDGCEVLYMMGEFFEPSLASGVRWDDPAFNIRLPLPISIMSDRDRTYADFTA